MVEQNALIVNGLNVPYTVATGQGTTEFTIKDATCTELFENLRSAKSQSM